ncbi:unnamed protein product [Parajaminaea phylloscopi]
MQAADLEAVIRDKIDDVQTLIVSDVSGGCGQAFDVVIVSPVFQGLPTLKRHRLVNDRLKDQIAQLHAFSQKTYTPAQYSDLSGPTANPKAKDGSAASALGLSSSNMPAPSAPSAAPSVPMSPPASSLVAPVTPPPRFRTSATASHNRTASNVSIPELTLTTDDDTLSGRSASKAPRPLSPGTQPGGTTQQLPEMHASPSSSLPSSISRLHHSKVTSVDFWEGLRAYLESQLISPASPSVGLTSPVASPGPNAAAAAASEARSKGEAELHRLWEDFFQSQKPHLSASDVAKVRDGVGMYGWV